MSFAPSTWIKTTLGCWIRGGASSQLAVLGLLALALACTGATVCEANHGPQAARVWFYDAPWFLCLLGLLAVNLLCATWVRWPWRWKQLGFVGTHYGIVFLLAGALIGRKFGSETLLRLHATEAVNETQMIFQQHAPVIVQHSGPPSGLRLSLLMKGAEPQIIVGTPLQQREIFFISAVLGKTIRLQGDAVQIEVERYWPDFVMEAGRPISRSEAPNNPALQVHLTRVADSGMNSETDTKRVEPLGVQVRLMHFDVPRDEGTDTPADFHSTVRFTDPNTGHEQVTVISMNHPVHYPTGFWRTALGLNTQFSQAQWNPGDLGETTLQVRRDPGWPFKWIGSIFLCAGLVGMIFYSPR